MEASALIPTIFRWALLRIFTAGVADPVAALRKVMAQPDKAVQAYIVPSEDPHMVGFHPVIYNYWHGGS